MEKKKFLFQNKSCCGLQAPSQRLVSHPRYYFFDASITNALAHTLSDHLNPHISGRRFEQFVICQIIAFINYKRLDYQLYYWRTNHGAEVDLLICRGNHILYAVEIKSSPNIAKESLTGLNSFISDNPKVPVYVLGEKQNRRQLDNGATILNWNEFIIEELLKT